MYVDSPNGKAAAGKAQLALNHGDTVRTLGSSAVVIQLEGGKSLTLGHDETLTLDDKLLALLNQKEEEGSLDEGVDFDALAEAIESGQNLEEILPVTAAGGDDLAQTPRVPLVVPVCEWIVRVILLRQTAGLIPVMGLAQPLVMRLEVVIMLTTSFWRRLTTISLKQV